MTFEEAYQKLREGTATDEEAAFVARELENVRKISAILDDPALSDPGIEQAEVETVQRARRAFNRKTLFRTVGIVVCSLLAIAAIVCAILFIPSNLSASEKQKISKAEAIEIALPGLWSRLARMPPNSTTSIMPTGICVMPEAFLRRYTSTGFSLRIRMTTNTPWRSMRIPVTR